MVAHAFNYLGGRGRQISVNSNLVYTASSRTVRATQRSPVSKNKTKQKNKNTNKNKNNNSKAKEGLEMWLSD